MLKTSARRFPEKEALVHGDQRLTYLEASKKVARLAHGLREIGTRRGDRVGVYLEASVPQALAILGIWEAGGVLVPVNSVLFPDQLAHIANDCRMKGLITTGAKLSGISRVLASIPSLEFAVLVDSSGESGQLLPVHSFDRLCSAQPPEHGTEASIEKDLAAILYTSGSTGKPKGVMLTHAQIMAGASIVSTYLEISDSDRILAVLPFSFDAGLNQLTTAIQQGATLVLMNFLFAKEIVQVLLKERVTGLAGVPTLWSLIAQPSSALHKHQFPCLRYITNTGGAMPQNVLAVLRKALPTTRIFLMYGLTEAFRSTYLPPEELDRRPTSIGKAIPNTEILVVNEQGQPCKPGEVGELVHRGPTVSLGYWGHPELTDRVLRTHPLLPPELREGEKVCYSGDLVKQDEDGFIYFVGRRDTMIKSSGFRISPTEVEEVLFQSGLVRGAAVIGLPDEVLGQHIKAFVVAKEGSMVDVDALLTFCAERMPRHMIPKVVECLEELPKTTSGKVDYPALRKREGLL
ncbi:MAG: acyl-CoA ligase (AMP-forming), exosortase A system-associated [Acidobacteriia bacterium]|nr:acyl-CoA ligase (AMP-forming), exosortase A system-associated [Terriglobia bacterium]